MLQMERVDTWVLMMGGGSGVDVFLVGRLSETCLFRASDAFFKSCPPIAARACVSARACREWLSNPGQA